MKALAFVLGFAVVACGASTETAGSASTGPPAPTTTTADTTDTTCSTVSENACALEDPIPDPTGTADVTIGDTTYQFEATRCLVTEDVFVIDGVSSNGSTLAIRHASPPTRVDPQPSMSYLLIEPDPAYESPPAAVTLEDYDPIAGTATGFVDETTSFSVRCER